jgi:hypothetical protein
MPWVAHIRLKRSCQSGGAGVALDFRLRKTQYPAANRASSTSENITHTIASARRNFAE